MIKGRLKWGLKPVSDGLFYVCQFRKKKHRLNTIYCILLV
nr:MAG TPA: hypothetical protein [Caudoviricetes sp.]DAQ54862.1 MAG TPA: hypothetical protein [Caudoviricetes sp.]